MIGHVTVAHKQFKMIDVSDTRIKQKAVIEFLTVEEIDPIDIHI